MATLAEYFFKTGSQQATTVVPALAAHALASASLDEQQRNLRWRRAWTAYEGDLPDPLKVRDGKPNDNIKLNYCRLIVDKGASFLFGDPLGFEEAEKEKSAYKKPETTAEAWLRKAWRANKLVSTLQKLATNGGVCGTCFLKVVPDSRLTAPYPRIIVIDPASMKVLTEPDDLEDVYCFIFSYVDIDKGGKPVRFEEVTERNQAGTWMITHRTVDLVSGIVKEEGPSEEWPYSWPPIFYCQNLVAPNEFWGIADLEEDIININVAINFVVSNINRILKHHAHPKTWGKGFTADSMETSVDEIIILPASDAFLGNLEMKSDLASSIDFYNKIKAAIHEVARVPQVSTGMIDNIAGTAGVSLMVMFQPLTEKTKTKRATYGDMIASVCKRMLEIGGFGADIDINIQWPALLPRDELQERQVAQLDHALGVSLDTLQSQLGYNPVAEREKSKLDPVVAAPGAAGAGAGAPSISRTGAVPFPGNNDGKNNDGKPVGDGLQNG